MTIQFEHLPWQPAPEFAHLSGGRHVLHDEASREYDAQMIAPHRPLVDTVHTVHTGPWDQGQVGSCTAHGALGMLMADPLWNGQWAFTEADCQQLYREETRIDDRQIPGHWEPDDTGSTGLWSMKALKRRGLISEYRWAFSIGTAHQILLDRAYSQGTIWFNSMFKVGSDGVLTVDPDSGTAGGHQYCAVGLDVEGRRTWYRQSWGNWGVTRHGMSGLFAITWKAQESLLHEYRGDVVTAVK